MELDTVEWTIGTTSAASTAPAAAFPPAEYEALFYRQSSAAPARLKNNPANPLTPSAIHPPRRARPTQRKLPVRIWTGLPSRILPAFPEGFQRAAAALIAISRLFCRLSLACLRLVTFAPANRPRGHRCGFFPASESGALAVASSTLDFVRVQITWLLPWVVKHILSLNGITRCTLRPQTYSTRGTNRTEDQFETN